MRVKETTVGSPVYSSVKAHLTDEEAKIPKRFLPTLLPLHRKEDHRGTHSPSAGRKVGVGWGSGNPYVSASSVHLLILESSVASQQRKLNIINAMLPCDCPLLGTRWRTDRPMQTGTDGMSLEGTKYTTQSWPKFSLSLSLVSKSGPLIKTPFGA